MMAKYDLKNRLDLGSKKERRTFWAGNLHLQRLKGAGSHGAKTASSLATWQL